MGFERGPSVIRRGDPEAGRWRFSYGGENENRMRGGLVKARPAKGGRNTLERKAQESYVLGKSLNRFFVVTDSRVEQSPEDGDCSKVSFRKPG